MDNTDPEVTRLLTDLHQDPDRGPEVASRLFATVHGELRRLASRLMRDERPGHTLQATALVHEAYLRLVDDKAVDWQSRAHFFGIAARAMRQILVDHARERASVKRGGRLQRVALDDQVGAASTNELDVLDLDRVLTGLAAFDERMAKVVEYRVFAGMTVEEAALVLGVSPRTVQSDWRVAKMWLSRQLVDGGISRPGEHREVGRPTPGSEPEPSGESD